jgi:hypothetical protein
MAMDAREAAARATAQQLALPIAAEHWPGVLRYHALAAGMAELVMGLPLQRDDESGSVFVPVPPAGASE